MADGISAPHGCGCGCRSEHVTPGAVVRHARCVSRWVLDTSIREFTMADDRNERNRDPQAGATGSDSESDLRDELQREQKEAKGGIGDIAEDRNLSGSSSWLTD